MYQLECCYREDTTVNTSHGHSNKHITDVDVTRVTETAKLK